MSESLKEFKLFWQLQVMFSLGILTRHEHWVNNLFKFRLLEYPNYIKVKTSWGGGYPTAFIFESINFKLLVIFEKKNLRIKKLYSQICTVYTVHIKNTHKDTDTKVGKGGQRCIQPVDNWGLVSPHPTGAIPPSHAEKNPVHVPTKVVNFVKYKKLLINMKIVSLIKNKINK